MSTLEDVFYLYERNSNYYYNCKSNNNDNNCDNCEFNCQNECLCYLNQCVYPHTIGDQCVPCNINRKCYLKPGVECSICLDNIINKSSAYLTSCGHPFHKKCLKEYLNIKWLNDKWTSVVGCPLCRASLGYPNFGNRYKYNYFNFIGGGNSNELDKLEDFWLNNEYQIPYFCINGYDHYLGVDKECRYCQNYRKNGDISP